MKHLYSSKESSLRADQSIYTYEKGPGNAGLDAKHTILDHVIHNGSRSYAIILTD